MATTAYVGKTAVSAFKVGAASVTDVLVGVGTPSGAPPDPPTRGPELITGPISSWSQSGATPPVVDGSGIHFVAGNTSTNSQFAVPTTEDDATYEVIFTIANYVNGQVQVRVYGATGAHTGVGTAVGANGTFTQQVVCTGVGSPTSQVRFTGVGSPVNLDITSVSVKKVLA